MRALQFNQPSAARNLPLLLDALRTHFHINLAGGSGPSNGGSLNPFDLLTIDDQLSFMDQVYEDALFVLFNASIREGRVFYSLGVEQSKDRDKFGKSAGLGYFPKGTKDTILVIFPPTFHITTNKDLFRTTSQQASTVLHEVCHYVPTACPRFRVCPDPVASRGTTIRSSPRKRRSIMPSRTTCLLST